MRLVSKFCMKMVDCQNCESNYCQCIHHEDQVVKPGLGDLEPVGGKFISRTADLGR